MTDHLTHTSLISKPVQAGDAGIIIRADGKPEMFNCFGNKGTAPTERQNETGLTLLAIMWALSDEEVLSELKVKMLRSGYIDKGVVAPASLS